MRPLILHPSASRSTMSSGSRRVAWSISVYHEAQRSYSPPASARHGEAIERSASNSSIGTKPRVALGSMDVVRREQREPFITADGSSIRELAGIPSGNARNQSLAEAVVPPAGATIAHLHRQSEELYLFTGGSGRMRLGDEERLVRAGDCVVIPPGVGHKLWADEQEPLVLLCCCSPPYSHADTVLLDE
jgi:mannose-6-phosphate isomerase-like protein (cupin superfamily)